MTIMLMMLFNIGLLFLWLYHTLCLATKNRTTIEHQEIHSQRDCDPKGSDSEPKDSQKNIYDLGFVGNLRSFLGNSCLVWWIPANIFVVGDGTIFETNNKKEIKVQLYSNLLTLQQNLAFF